MNFIAKQRALAREVEELRERVAKLEAKLAEAAPAKKRGRPPKVAPPSA